MLLGRRRSLCSLFGLSSDSMSLPRRRQIRTLALLFCVITFTTFLFSYTLRDPSLDFFKYASRLSDNLFFSSGGPCACRRRCMTEAEDDPWFAERFNRSVRPLMTRENSVLSDDTFKWWQVRSLGRGGVGGAKRCSTISHNDRYVVKFFGVF